MTTGARDWVLHLMMVFSGLSVGAGHALSAGETDWRRILGRALVTSGLSVSAGAGILFFGQIPDLALVGLASGIAVLGASVLERVVVQYLQRMGANG